MKEVISTISSKGQLTIPAEVRRHLGVQSHDKVAFVIESEGEVKLKVPRYTDVDSVVGKAGSLKTPLSGQEMRTIAKEDRLKRKYAPKP